MATATIRPLPIDQALGPDETNGSSGSQEQSPGRLLALVVSVALAIRLIVAAFIFRGLSDPADHFQSFGEEVGWIARSIALHRGFSSPFFPTTGPTALLPPLYPYLLAGVFKVFGIYSTSSALVILFLNSLFSALTCIPIYLATRISVNARTARYAGWAWAIYPFAIYFSAGRVWEYSLTSLILTTCFWLALTLDRTSHPARWLGVGLLFGLAALSNPAVLSLFPVLLLLPLWRLYRDMRSTALRGQFRVSLLRNGLSIGLGVLAVLTPWTVRNYRVMHVLCPVRDCFWYEFWSANNGDGSNPTLGWTHPASNPVELQLYQSQGEIRYIAQKRAMVREFVSHHHAFFAGITLRHIFYYWTGFWSFDPSYVRQEPFQAPNIFFCSSLTLLMIFGALSWGRRDPSAAMPYLLSIAVFPVAYYISHPLMDYRQPIEPAIVVLVVVGLRAVKAAVASQLEIVRAVSGVEVSRIEIPVGHSFLPEEPDYAETAVAAAIGEPSATAG
jgi:4-amino-4-deoxy-L-arabinose transferase-like glycosyltransferase